MRKKSLCVDRGRSCFHLLDHEQGQDKMDPHHQRTYAKILEVK